MINSILLIYLKKLGKYLLNLGTNKRQSAVLRQNIINISKHAFFLNLVQRFFE